MRAKVKVYSGKQLSKNGKILMGGYFNLFNTRGTYSQYFSIKMSQMYNGSKLRDSSVFMD